jgi:hypothetical protein
MKRSVGERMMLDFWITHEFAEIALVTYSKTTI